ncbi:MAG: hypothetical protein BWZ10_01058 [candidate division BRC1 bacterium ADurb.BinA364]|nr:MAG: hypothetical protein BWZ10_01058 [candidate division BRC1 bacterium ADurb.BinA364]
MDQAGQALFQPHEGAELGQSGNLARHLRPLGVALFGCRPGIGHQPFAAESNLARFRIQFQDFRLDRIAGAHVIDRRCGALPRNFLARDEGLDAVQIDEHAEVEHRLGHAPHHIALAMAAQELVAQLVAAHLHQLAPRNHGSAAPAVQLEHEKLDFPPNPFFQLLHAAQIDLRGRHEAIHAAIDDQARLDGAGTDACQRRFLLHGIGEDIQRLDALGRAVRNANLAFLGVAALNQHFDFIADLHRDFAHRGDKIADGSDPLGFVVQVDQDGILADGDHHADADFSLLGLLHVVQIGVHQGVLFGCGFGSLLGKLLVFLLGLLVHRRGRVFRIGHCLTSSKG